MQQQCRVPAPCIPATQQLSPACLPLALQLVAGGRGILAADESTTTVGKRLASIGVENSAPNRAALRRMLFGAPGLERHISGVILFEETLLQADDAAGGAAAAGQARLVDLLSSQGVLLGIKVDTGLAPLPVSPGESFTQGFDNLAARCAKAKAAGASFAKWRAVLHIRQACATSPGLPSEAAVAAAAQGLALYAAISQAAGLVPIVEPEVLADGDHGIELCEAVTQRVLAAVFKALADAGVLLEGMLLKPNMVTPGSSAPAAAADDVAAATLRVLRRTVPPAVPGIVFLSGGQSEADATRHLALMNSGALAGSKPWVLSFSYGRALQASALQAWGGQAGNAAAGQAAFMARAAANSAAARGGEEAAPNSS
ncbi:cytosolic aldolase [Scenedesmus sp. NREL 46B-D3]|nr:cytosolic aldolase [Scenedesmus sp. NREL 46B-D3]